MGNQPPQRPAAAPAAQTEPRPDGTNAGSPLLAALAKERAALHKALVQNAKAQFSECRDKHSENKAFDVARDCNTVSVSERDVPAIWAALNRMESESIGAALDTSAGMTLHEQRMCAREQAGSLVKQHFPGVDSVDWWHGTWTGTVAFDFRGAERKRPDSRDAR